ncbi:MAG: phage major capsid protein [Bacteroidales bacterium]|nr:phage major capsid protein [Bacteroidales bacterium]
MELKEMTIEALEERKSQIASEVAEAEGETLDALEEEVRAIKEEMESRKAEEAKRNEVRSIVAQGEGETIKKVESEERNMPTLAEIRSSEEYINAYAEYIKSEDDTECRSLLTENVSGGTVAVPTIVEDIVKTAWQKEGIISRVRKSYVKGNLKVGFEISATGAVKHTEGSGKVTEETLVLGTVELVPVSIKKWISISDEALDLRGEAFLEYIYDELVYQIAKKAADEVIAKIEACGTQSTSTCVGVPVITSTQISVDLTAQALGQLSDEAANPVVMMNKATWAAFKQAQYANKFSVDPFEGLDVVFNNTIKAFSAASTGDTYMIVGDLGHGAQANFPNGEDIDLKVDDKTLMEEDLVRVLGREYVGIGIVAPDAFVKVQK